MDKTFDVDGFPQFFPTTVLNQVREDHLQCYAMQGVFGLDVTHCYLLRDWRPRILHLRCRVDDVFARVRGRIDKPGEDASIESPR